MSRSILLPIFGLMGIILYGTTRASRPPEPEAGAYETGPEIIEMEPSQPLQRAAPPPPPAAPRLQSDVEAERLALEAELRDATARRLREQGLDSTAAADPSPRPEASDAETGYVPAPLTPTQ